MRTARTVGDLRQAVAAWRGEGHSVGLVPTMGGLHDGHLSLVRRARAESDRTVATVFVNPRQFAPDEDFADYPRREAADAALLAAEGADLMFAPPREEMYPDGFTTTVSVPDLSQGLCAESRPHFFDGVATVVAKLLIQCLPDAAYFGEKDYQQLQVIRRLARDLDLPVRIEGVPTVREPDGLALSSRNAYLTDAERRIAPALHRAMAGAVDRLAAGAAPAGALAACRDEILGAGFASVDYVSLADAETLAPLDALDALGGRAARLLAAAWLGKARLIDNLAVSRAGA